MQIFGPWEQPPSKKVISGDPPSLPPSLLPLTVPMREKGKPGVGAVKTEEKVLWLLFLFDSFFDEVDTTSLFYLSIRNRFGGTSNRQKNVSKDLNVIK